MKKLFIIDCHSLIYKAYFAIQRLTDSKGESTNAIYGFSRMLLKIIGDYSPDYLVAVFDIGKRTFRNELFSDYKATRKPTPADLIPQFNHIKRIISALNIPVMQLENYEADDIIGSIAEKYKDKTKIYILTGDKDLNQLICESITILNSKKGVTDLVSINRKNFEDKYEIKLPQFKDYLALIGDSSDNVPGVAGIGPKTAVKLLREYSDIDDIYANITKITPDSLRMKLLSNKENAYLSKKLVSIITNLNIDIEIPAFDKSYINNLRNLFAEFEFYSLIKELNSAPAHLPTTVSTGLAGDSSNQSDIADSQSQQLPKETEIESQLDDASEEKTQAANQSVANAALIAGLSSPETYMPVPILQILSIDEFSEFIKSVSKKENESAQSPGIFIFPATLNNEKIIYFKFADNIRYFNADCRALLQAFYDFVRSKNLIIYGYDLKNVCRLLLNLNADIDLLNLFDYKIINGILSKDEPLDKLLFNYFKINIKTIENLEIVQTDLFEIKIDENSISTVNNFFYYYTLLSFKLADKLSETGQSKIYNEVEKPLIPLIIKMESEGVAVDAEYLRGLNIKVNLHISEITGKIFNLIKTEINLNSPKQISEILYGKLQLPVQRKTKTGLSTDNDSLGKIRYLHPVVDLILEYRKYIKIQNTYIQPLLDNIDSANKIHTVFNQTGAITGRFSSYNPNLQNIPSTTDDSLNIRKAFVVGRQDYTLIGADYSQIELRIIAHLAEDEYMISAFKNGMDIHHSTACRIFNINDTSKISPEMRRLAKIINFGVLYGMTAHSLAEETGLPYYRAKEFIENYFAKFASIGKYFEQVIESASITGYTETLYGRRRYIPELKNKNKNIRQSGVRMAINMPVQGTAADILKMAMLKLYAGLDNYKARLLLTIHDELIFTAPTDKTAEFKEYLRAVMENIVSLKVPLKVTISAGKTMSELK